MGHEKLRVAVALLSLSFFATVYLLVGLGAPPDWGPAFLALSACYLLAFVALAADWFWARWVASGLGWSGSMVGLVGLVSLGWHPALGVYTGLHGLVVLALLGPQMAARYDLQPAWRERYAMDEFGVARLRKAVTRASASLPSLILWALGPKDGQGAAVFALGLGAAALAGVAGLVRLRSWSIPVLATSGAAIALLGAGPGQLAGLVLLAAVAPLVGPALRYLRSLPR